MKKTFPKRYNPPKMRFSQLVQHTDEKCAQWLQSQPEDIVKRFCTKDQRYTRKSDVYVQELAVATEKPMSFLVQEIGFGSMTIPYLVIFDFDRNVSVFFPTQTAETETN